MGKALVDQRGVQQPGAALAGPAPARQSLRSRGVREQRKRRSATDSWLNECQSKKVWP